MITPEQLAANSSEHSQQVALFAWAAQNADKIPELRLLFAIPNGGKRDKVTAARLKAEGVRAGVPDIFWPVARNAEITARMVTWRGLFIEMKAVDGRVSDEQDKWIADLEAQGYCCCVAWSFAQARQCILNYWEGKPINTRRDVPLSIDPKDTGHVIP